MVYTNSPLLADSGVAQYISLALFLHIRFDSKRAIKTYSGLGCSYLRIQFLTWKMIFPESHTKTSRNTISHKKKTSQKNKNTCVCISVPFLLLMIILFLFLQTIVAVWLLFCYRHPHYNIAHDIFSNNNNNNALLLCLSSFSLHVISQCIVIVVFVFISLFFLSCMYNNMVTKASVCEFRTAAHQVPLYFSLLYIYYDAKGDCNSSPFHRIV